MSALCVPLVINTSVVAALRSATPLNTPNLSRRALDSSDRTFQFDVQEVPVTPEYSVEDSMQHAGYTPLRQLEETLQGSVWAASSDQSKSEVTDIVKVTCRSLHEQRVTMITGKSIAVSENIIKEKTILKYLSERDPPQSLAKYKDFFGDENNYFLVLEYAGKRSLFDVVKRCHGLIEQKVLSVEEWQTFCLTAAKQIVNLLDWMHNVMHCCHLDISLENLVIDHLMVTKEVDSEQITLSRDFQIKLIDFGVAEVFGRDKGRIDFMCSKFVGKSAYKAPEVYSERRPFDARAADCFSFGVSLFMMLFGCPPWSKPCKRDLCFQAVMKGSLTEILRQWNRLHYATPHMLLLLSRLFQPERQRVTMRDIKTNYLC